MLTIKLTPAQVSAVGTYITESIHEEDYPEAKLAGSILVIDAGYDRAIEILVDACNSADVGDTGDDKTADKRARKALENVLDKIGKMYKQHRQAT